MADGLIGRKNLLNGVLEGVRASKDEAQKHVAMDAWPIATKGYEAARETVMNTPSAISAHKLNRRLTGTMLDDIGLDVTEKGNTFTMHAGWLHEQIQYFAIQDQGGEGYGAYAGIFITPMHALRHAKTAMALEASKRGYTL